MIIRFDSNWVDVLGQTKEKSVNAIPSHCILVFLGEKMRVPEIESVLILISMIFRISYILKIVKGIFEPHWVHMIATSNLSIGSGVLYHYICILEIAVKRFLLFDKIIEYWDYEKNMCNVSFWFPDFDNRWHYLFTI